MSGPHRRAAGSYWRDAVNWAADRKLHPKRSDGLRWWQLLTLARALEHDTAGHLIWPVVVLSGPRQTGKSWLERVICGWRIEQGERFGEEQTVLHVAHKLDAAREVWRPAARAAPAWGGVVRWANGEQQIELEPDLGEAGDWGGRWLLQAANDGTGVAYSLAMALIDEGWRVARRVYEEGIAPTMAEAESPQAWLVSTAGTADSDLMLTYRGNAITQLRRPRGVLLIEWSAPPEPELDIDDPAVWRSAQPHWDAKRLAWIRHYRDTADERAFRQHALNQWVPSLTPPALAPGTWGAVSTRRAPAGSLAFGVEVAEDQSAAVIVSLGEGVGEVIEETAVHLAAGRMADLAERYAAVLGVDGSGPSRGVADELKTAGLAVAVMTAGQMAAASGQVRAALLARPPLLLARDHPAMEAAITGARKRKVGGSWAWDRGLVTLPLNALTAAWWARDHAPAPLDEPMVYA